jgi:hypothetical protein
MFMNRRGRSSANRRRLEKGAYKKNGLEFVRFFVYRVRAGKRNNRVNQPDLQYVPLRADCPPATIADSGITGKNNRVYD